MKRFRQGYQRPLWRRAPAVLRPDFQRHGVRTPLVVWGLLATAGVVLAIGLLDLLALREQASAERDRLARWERQARPAARPAAAPPSQAPHPGQAAAWRIAEGLAHPWARILAATEGAVSSDVQWLAFEHDSARPDVRLEGQSPDPRAALKAVDALAVQPGWSNLVLTRLAGRPAASSAALGASADGAEVGAPQRFEITAQLRIPAPASGAASGADFGAASGAASRPSSATGEP